MNPPPDGQVSGDRPSQDGPGSFAASPVAAGTQGLPATRRRGVMLCVLLGITMTSLDGAIANIALPTLAKAFGASNAATVWVVNGYFLAVAVCLLPAAALGEILGFRRVFGLGFAVFGLASLACALSGSLPALVAARLVQGIGGACVVALAPALVRATYPRHQIGGAVGLMALTVAMSSTLGPSIAALILSGAAWPWLFLVNLPLCLLAVPLFLASAPADVRSPRPLDPAGALLSAVALGLFVLGVDMLGGRHPGAAAASLAAGVGCFVLLIRQQAGRPAPLLPLDLLRLPVFALSAVTSVCSFTAQILALVSLPFLFETQMQRSPVAVGMLITPWPLLVCFSAPLAGRLSKRHSPALLVSLGMAVLATGLLLLATLPPAPTDWDIGWRMAICGAGFGFGQTPNNITMMTTGPAERSGAAGGVQAVARTFGWCLGSALVTLILTLAHANGTTVCLAVATGFAVLAALVSSARLRAAN